MDGSVLEILSEKFVKPSTSTPPSLRCYKLSLNDQLSTWTYVGMAFFYPNQGCDSPIRSPTETSRILDIALSKTLSYYYPFAGRIMNNLFVECNDMGVQFTEARIKCTMTEFLKQPNSQLKDLGFHESLISGNVGDSSLVLVQVSYFDCAGMAVSICMSHKLGDASTLFTFIHDWAAMVRQSSHIPSPHFIGASLFPPVDDPSFIKEVILCKTVNPVRKYLFHASKIAELKEMAVNSGVENPTRVEVVTALLFRCFMVSSRAISGSFKPSLLMQALNLRPVTTPPLPKDSVGNLYTSLTVATTKEEMMTLSGLVSQLRNAKVTLQNEYKEKAKANGSPPVEVAKKDLMNQIGGTDMDIYYCSSWCRFPFYEVDFGWGKPISLSLPIYGGSMNVVVLMDTRNEDGIEAIVTLKEPQMSTFETNEELLAFASLRASHI